MIHQLKQWWQNNRTYGENSRFNSAYLHTKELNAGATIAQALSTLIIPDTSRVWGPDISHWDGNVNLSVTKQMGASFVFIKGLDGTIRTSNYLANRQRAIDAGLPQAPYAWLYPHKYVSVLAQAKALADLLVNYPAALPPVIDFEWTFWGGSAANPNFGDLDMWVTEFTRLTGIKPIVYTAAGYSNMFGTFPATLKAKFAGLWVANYGVTSPTLPNGWSEWLYWQFTSSGDAAVYAPNDVNKKELDLNYRFRTVSEPPTGETMYYLANGAITIRTGAGTSNAQVTSGELYVLAGDILEVVESLNGFVRFVKLYRNNVSMALAPVTWCGSSYLSVTAYIPPVTTPSIFVTHDFSDVMIVDGKRYTANFSVDNVEYTPEAQ
jgi:GH25 family lysozyme M1 (1,4-beta-N-acetylmuramidase)